MMRPSLLVFAVVSLFSFHAAAQNTPPVVTNSLPQITVYASGPPAPIDLTSYFKDSDVTTAVRMNTVLGTIDIGLFGNQTPITVANFLKYVTQGKYFILDPTTEQVAPSFIHRAVPNFVIQGGGFLATVHPQNPNYFYPTAVSTFSPIQNEFGISNKRGTIAMAKIPAKDPQGNPIPGGGPDSATSQWFINLADNGGSPNNLDTENGGYTVFGRVGGSGMTIADAIAALPRYNASNVFGGSFSSLPLRNYNNSDAIKPANLVTIPEFKQIGTLSFSASSNNTDAAGVSVSGTTLFVQGNQVGSAQITVTAIDLDGASVSQSFNVNVIAMPGHLANISTRLQAGTGQNVLIAGFLVQGNGTPKRLMIRGIGPSLSVNGQPIPGRLADPTLELHSSAGTIATNNNWGDGNGPAIQATGIAPSSFLESAILMTVPSSAAGTPYTAILQGAGGTTGLGSVEVYDLDSGPGSFLVNISTRGQISTDPNVLIGGFIITGSDAKKVLIRGLGPSLPPAQVSNPLANPFIELHDANGTQIATNDDWQSNSNASEIQATGAAPTNPQESALLTTLQPALYTAILRGVNNGAGVGLIEIYQL